MRRLRTLHPLNCQLKLAGTLYFAHQVGVDLEDQVLFLQDPVLGELTFGASNDLKLDYLDLEVPTAIRNRLMDLGWVTMTCHELLDFAATLQE